MNRAPGNQAPGSPPRQVEQNNLANQGNVYEERAAARAAEQAQGNDVQPAAGQRLFSTDPPQQVRQNTRGINPLTNPTRKHGGKSKRKTNKGRTKKNKRKSSKRSKRA